MILQLDKSKLERQMRAVGFDNYDDVANEARRLGMKLSARTVYSMLSGENWSREKLEALCVALQCQPADLVNGWQTNAGNYTHTHASPRLAEELQAEPA